MQAVLDKEFVRPKSDKLLGVLILRGDGMPGHLLLRHFAPRHETEAANRFSMPARFIGSWRE